MNPHLLLPADSGREQDGHIAATVRIDRAFVGAVMAPHPIVQELNGLHHEYHLIREAA